MTDILSTEVPLFTKDDMIMTDNGYYANMSLFHTGGGNIVSDNYKNLGFPVLYLYAINDNCYKQHDNEIMSDEPSDNEILSDDLYNKLISLAEMKPVINKKYTKNKKNINKQNVKKNKGKKTRRNKIL